MAEVYDAAHPMKCVVDNWLKKIAQAEEVKWEEFGQYAHEANMFFDGPANWMWDPKYNQAPGGFLNPGTPSDYMPTFRIMVNRVFEAVAIFGPALFFKYPDIMVSPIDPPEIDPQFLGVPVDSLEYPALVEQQQAAQALRHTIASVKQAYLNWLQVEGGKKTEARRSITEAIVKGLGVLVTEMYQPPGSEIRYPWTRHLSCDHLVKDPDAEYEDAVQWKGIYNCAPVNLVERKFNLPPGSLKGHLQSYASQATPKGNRDAKANRKESKSWDMIEWWDVYSKNGFGDRLKTSNANAINSPYDFNEAGDFCYLAVAKNIPYPLNAPSETLQNKEDFLERVRWPISFWTDGGWPVVELGFYEKARTTWPISLIKPAIGELRFVNWCMSFLADKAAAACTDYLGVVKQAAEDIRAQLEKGSGPYKIIEISQLMGKTIKDVVSFIEAPDFHESIWKMVAEVLELIDKRTGLTELVYGLSGTQIRSATEADIRSGNISIRPDEMASQTEDWLSASCINEMLAACSELDGQDVVGPLGPMGAAFFEQHIMTQDIDSIVRDFDYRVAAGSARKPNKQRKAQSLNDLGQVIVPLLQELAVAGMPQPWNAYVTDVAEANDLDASGYLVPEPDPNAPQPPSEEDVAIQAKLAELQLKQEEMGAQLGFQAAEHDQTMRHEQQRHNLEMKQDRQKGQQDAKLMEQKGRLQTALMKQRASAQKKTASKNGSKK